MSSEVNVNSLLVGRCWLDGKSGFYLRFSSILIVGRDVVVVKK